YGKQAIERVLQLTARYPYLIQSLCHRVFEECARAEERSVPATRVDEAAGLLVEGNEHFRTLWDLAGSARRRYLACIVDRLSKGPDRVTFDLLAQVMEREGISPRSLGRDLEELEELEILAAKQDRSSRWYEIRIPLLSRWLHHEQDAERWRLDARKEQEEALT